MPRLSTASWIRSAYLSPTWRNSTVGTRTNKTPPQEWLSLVGLSQVSYECRLIFFSSASRMRNHGFGDKVGVETDIYNSRGLAAKASAGISIVAEDFMFPAEQPRTGRGGYAGARKISLSWISSA